MCSASFSSWPLKGQKTVHTNSKQGHTRTLVAKKIFTNVCPFFKTMAFLMGYFDFKLVGFLLNWLACCKTGCFDVESVVLLLD